MAFSAVGPVVGGVVKAVTLNEILDETGRNALETYWRDHEPALRAGASAMTDEVRLQTIAELHKWRDQLAAQRAVLESTRTPAPVAGPDDDLDALADHTRPGLADHDGHLLEETVDEAEQTLTRDVEGSEAKRTTPLPRWDRRQRRSS